MRNGGFACLEGDMGLLLDHLHGIGQLQTGEIFLRKDLSSEWSKAHAIEVLLREGKTEEAIRIPAPQIAHWDSYKMLLACARERRIGDKGLGFQGRDR